MSTTLAITGWSVLTSAGIGADEFAGAVVEGRSGLTDVAGMFDEEPLPERRAGAITGFKVRDYLGRKGTSFFDRSTSLALVGCTLALRDTDFELAEDNRERTGIVMGTTTGSLQSTSEYTRETLTQDKPYLVNPLLFPNTVMNCAAGQSAIWHRLKGVNATIAGGQLAGLNALRYAKNTIRRQYADTLLVGAVDEFSPHTAWQTHLANVARGVTVPLGEGSAVFVVEDAAKLNGRRPDAEILAVELGTYGPPGQQPDAGDGLAVCIARALDRAGVAASDVWAVASGETGADDVEPRGIAQALGNVRKVLIKELLGECHAASGALQLAALLAHHRSDPALDGQVSVVTSCSADGAVGAAVVRGWSRAGRDHG
jgi:3-oxoacyl-[acyl-carrier-protein] synthase II